MSPVLRLAGPAALILAAATTGAPAAITYSTVNLTPSAATQGHALAAFAAQQAGDSTAGATLHATVWTSTANSPADLHPSVVSNDSQASSYLNGINGARQVGYVSSNFNYGNFNYHAYAWAGTAASAVDLHPAGFVSSLATATGGNQTVGQAKGSSTFNAYHAMLWTDNSSAAADLNPTYQVTASLSTTASESFANSVANGVQVGTATVLRFNTFSNPQPHAYVWSGSAASAIDINPGGFTQSVAFATTGTQHGGKGLTVAGPTHALLWTSSSAASAIDINPAGFDSSEIHAMADGIQAGFGFNVAALNTHAVAWFGSAASAVDLHAFLPPGYTSSQALGVTAEGYIVGTATSPTQTDAFLWIPGNLPEPASLGLPALAAVAFGRRRRR